jgi:hypothetical protein
MPQCSERTFNLLLVLYSGMAIDARSRYQEEKGWGCSYATFLHVLIVVWSCMST